MSRLDALIGSTRKYNIKKALYDELTDTIIYWNSKRLYINYKYLNGNTYCYMTTYEDSQGNLVVMPISASSLKVHGTTTPPQQRPQQMTIFDFI